jgi:hypothetical protein
VDPVALRLREGGGDSEKQPAHAVGGNIAAEIEQAERMK